MDKEQADNLRTVLGEDGTIRFGVRTKNTPQNVAIHESFKRFCEQECNNDYTLGLKFLMDAIESDFKYEALSERLNYMKTEIDELRTTVMYLKKNQKESVKDDEGAF
jgi:hypothetical protein